MSPDDRRLKIAYLDYRSVLFGFDRARRLREAVGTGRPFVLTVEELDLPDDVKVVSVHVDGPRDGFAVVLRSASFEPVPPGQCVPHVGEVNARVATFRVLSEDARD